MTFICSLYSCDSSFLEVPSKTSLTASIYFKTKDDFQQAINGAYGPLLGLYGGTSGAWAMGEMRSDNTTYKYNSNDRGTIAPEFIKDFLDDATNPVSSNKYNQNYIMIARVNQILDLIDGVEFDATIKSNIKGQALFLRALAYFDLVQYFGSVPLHITTAKTLEQTALPLSTIDVIYNQIIDDATAAAELLPDKATQDPGRATSGAANTLLGNVYIIQKKWAEAEFTLKKVTGYSLLPNYADVFEPAQKNNAESIFEVQYKQGTEGFASSFFYTFLVQPISANEVSAVTGITEVARTTEGYNIPTPDLINVYEGNDSRKDASIGYIIAGGVSYPYIKKYSHTHMLSGNTDDNWPVYRYSEVLLFLAEALNEQSKSTEALTFLNQVRDRAFGAGVSLISETDKVALRDLILKERRVELAFENKRWLDLVRAEIAESVMTAYGNNVKANPQDYYFPAGISVSSSSYTNIRLNFPIPASQVALSPYF
jgi:hypothetical protein